MKRLSCEELIERVIQGNANAQDEMYKRYYPFVFAISMKYLKNRQDAEDIAQIIYIKIILERKVGQFQGKSRFKSWLYRVTQNECIGLLRKKKKMNYEWLGAHELICTQSCGIIRRMLAREKMNAGLLRINSKCARALDMYYFKEYPYKKISEEMKISKGEVGVLLQRGRMMLAKYFKFNPTNYLWI